MSHLPTADVAYLEKPATRAISIHQRNEPNNAAPFAGRLGGNQAFVVGHEDELRESGIHDATPGMTFQEQFDLRAFARLGLWKAAVIEGVGTSLLTFLSVYANISPNTLPTPFTAQYGYFNNAAYLGPLTGGVINFLLLTLFTFAFGVVSGAHLNPTITLATFFARLSSFPRTVLYIAFQVAGGAIGGLFVRAGYGGRDFKTGGCWLFPSVVPVRDAFAIEFMATLALIFLAFGVGLDPRQRGVIPASLSPFLVGMTLGTISWVTGYERYGYGGASMNPARCFGAMVGARFEGWYWILWVADLCACMLHGGIYFLAPPGKATY